MKYSTKLGDQICKETSRSSIGLRHICKKLNIPYSTVTDWIYDPKHEMYNKYHHAKQQQMYYLAEEIVNIIDDHTNDYMEVIQNGKKKTVLNREHISRTRLRVQTRMNIITKLAPILYGIKPEKTKHTVIMPGPPEAKTKSPIPEQHPQPVSKAQSGDRPAPPSECLVLKKPYT